jgi:hypothetical protein
MSAIALETPVADETLRAIHFFNGRLLSGEDLSLEQAAHREARQHLGRTIGDGIAYGLEVSESSIASPPAAPTVTINAGLAINRCGQTLHLNHNVDVSLARPVSGVAAGTTGTIFAECQPPEGGVYIAGAGVYLLTIAPAATSEGRAPVNGLGNMTASCNTRYTVEGVLFRLLQVDLPSGELSDPARLRNRLALRCFAPGALGTFSSDPFGPLPEGYGLLDELRPNRLTDSDIPLALVYWTADGIQFIDLWSVRRCVTPPCAAGRWALAVGERRRSEATAMFLQFQDQIQTLRTTATNLQALVATERFVYLPPVGLLPAAQDGTSPGIAYQTFFHQQAYHPPVFIEEAVIEPLIRAALPYPPINLERQDPIRLYRVVSETNVRPYVLFSSAHVPLLGEARFDVVRWNFSNFA